MSFHISVILSHDFKRVNILQEPAGCYLLSINTFTWGCVCVCVYCPFKSVTFPVPLPLGLTKKKNDNTKWGDTIKTFGNDILKLWLTFFLWFKQAMLYLAYRAQDNSPLLSAGGIKGDVRRLKKQVQTVRIGPQSDKPNHGNLKSRLR